MKKFVIILLCLGFVLPMSACAGNKATIGIIGGADGPTAIYVTGDSDKFSSSASNDNDEKSLQIADVCRQFLNEKQPETIPTITNFETPALKILDELPAGGAYMKVADEAGAGPYYEVTFTTTADDMIGPIVFLVNQKTEIIGLFYRE